jgi:NodT family efflux transporter outer membrane factor (OMF) lipoprotein
MLLVASGSLSACGVTREYEQPDMAVPEEYRGINPSSKGAPADTSVAMLPYRSFFSDSTLCELIDAAMAHNFDLLKALSNIDYANESLKVAKLGNLPTLNLGVQAVRTNPSDNGLNALPIGQTSVDDHTVTATASWEADIWGKIRSKKKSALANYLKTKEAANTVRTTIVANVASGYYNLLMLDAQLEISKKNLELAKTTLKMTRLQYDAGQTTSLAIQQQEALLQNIEGSLPALEQKISAQENALSILCGSMPSSIKRERVLFTTKIADSFSSGIPSALLQNRPDVRSAELALRAAHADMGAAKASLYPSLTISGSGGVEAVKASDWFTLPGALFGTVQAGLIQPVFQRGQLKAQYHQSEIVRDQAELSFKQSVIQAVGEVSNALVQLDKVKERERIAEQRSATLHKAVDNAGSLFNSAMVTYLDVLTAETNSLQADLDLASIRSQHMTAISELYRSLGGGWR